MRTRIRTNGYRFNVQVRKFLFFWSTIQRPEDLNNKDFGGDMSFDTYGEAEKYIKHRLTDPKWTVVHSPPASEDRKV